MLPTVLGEFRAEFTSRGLRALDFPGCANAREPGPVEEAPAVFGPLIQQTQEALDRTARGGRPDRLPSLDWSGATAFQRTVWRELLRIPPGTIRSYGEIARRIGRPGASRAVGAACGANPIPVLVPCHRVLASSGALGGFSAGPDWKRRLLAREGIYPTRASSRA